MYRLTHRWVLPTSAPARLAGRAPPGRRRRGQTGPLRQRRAVQQPLARGADKRFDDAVREIKDKYKHDLVVETYEKPEGPESV